jgi:hypothetical protein
MTCGGVLLISQEGVEDGAAADEEVNERAHQIPYYIFHVVEGHPTPPLMIRKKKANVVTTVFTTADAINIFCEMPTKSMGQPRVCI